MRAGKWLPALSLLLCLAAPLSSFGMSAAEGQTQPSMEEMAGEMGIQEEMDQIQEFLDHTSGQDGTVSVWELMKALASGNLKEVFSQAGEGIRRALFSELYTGGSLLIQVAVIGMMGAVFSNVSSILKGGQISDTGFFVAYLLMFTCLAGSFLSSIQIAAGVLEQILDFMKCLMPAYFMAVAFSGGSASAVALYEGMLGGVTAVQWLCGGILLPAVKVYVLLVLGTHVVREPFLTRLTELLEQAIGWSLKTLMGLVMGVQFLQTMILPYADAAGQAGVKRVIEIIPGLGQGAGAVAQMVLGSGVLIKNSLGAAAVVILALLTLVPVLKLLLLMLLYQSVAAVMQPVCDKRMVSCVAGVSRGHKLLLQVVLYSLLLFIIAIAVTCASTNVNYFAS